MPRWVIRRTNQLVCVRLNEELGYRLLKAEAFLLCAIHADMQRFFVVQAKHTDKAFSVNLLFFVSNKDLEGLRHGKLYKFLHPTERPN